VGLAPSYACLCAAQALLVAAPAPRARERGDARLGLLLPAGLLAVGVLVLRLAAGGPRTLTVLAAVGAPLLAGVAGILRGSARWWLWPPAAAALWLVAWQAHGLVADAAAVALIGCACLGAAGAVARVAPQRAIAAGLVLLAVLDVVLVWGTPQVETASTALHAVSTGLPGLQDATFGGATMGWLDLLAPALLAVVVRLRLRAAVVTGVAAGLWGLLLFTTSTVPATVPVLAGLVAGRL
jgi:hypothetical protein